MDYIPPGGICQSLGIRRRWVLLLSLSLGSVADSLGPTPVETRSRHWQDPIRGSTAQTFVGTAEDEPMSTLQSLSLACIVLVVVFDYTNGFHDASSIIGTAIASRAMTPGQAVALVATFEFLGPVLGGTAVANTIGRVVDLGDLEGTVSLGVVLAGLLGAIGWNLVTWWLGIPSSSSHALVGGLVGPVMLSAGPDHVAWGVEALLREGRLEGVLKILLALVLSPIAGICIGFLIHRTSLWLLRGARPSVNRRLRKTQWLTTAFLAFSHGANDAQKSMGVLTMVLVLGGFLPVFEVPPWAILLCSAAISAGILSGGWRIVRTIGFGIYKVRPLHALNSQLTSAGLILGAALSGAPVSTTHVVSSSIMGIGASERPRAVRWTKAREIATTWFITMPGAALMAIVAYALIRILPGMPR